MKLDRDSLSKPGSKIFLSYTSVDAQLINQAERRWSLKILMSKGLGPENFWKRRNIL